MSAQSEVVLPRRTSGDDVIRLIEARAKGRDLSQIRTLNFSEHSFDGSLTAAVAFGLLDPSTTELTKSGSELALAPKEDKPQLLLKGMLRFEAYELLLGAVFSKGQPQDTTLEWIETWWSTHGYGNSQTNRDEGASSLARFVEYVGVGGYVQGRRGFVTRIEWRPDALSKVEAAAATTAERTMDVSGTGGAKLSTIMSRDEAGSPNREGSFVHELVRRKPPIEGNSALSLNLGDGRAVELSLPPRVTSAEKRRLIALMELMIDVEDVMTNSPKEEEG